MEWEREKENLLNTERGETNGGEAERIELQYIGSSGGRSVCVYRMYVCVCVRGKLRSGNLTSVAPFNLSCPPTTSRFLINTSVEYNHSFHLSFPSFFLSLVFLSSSFPLSLIITLIYHFITQSYVYSCWPICEGGVIFFCVALINQ